MVDHPVAVSDRAPVIGMRPNLGLAGCTSSPGSPSGIIPGSTLRTGVLVERRCGWSSGLSDLPLDVGHTGPTIGEVAR
jgi:hypothetical protein